MSGDRRRIAALALMLLASSEAQPASRVRSVRDLPAFVPGEVLVRFRASSDAATRESAVRTLGVLRSGRRTPFDKVRLGPGLAMEQALRTLRADPSVEWAQPNHRFYALCLPGDPYSADNSWPALLIEAPAAWDAAVAPATCPGTVPGSSSVTVAVIDSGVFAAHPDLAPILAAPSQWWNSVDDNADVSDDNGHGTFLCGIIGARWDGVLAPSPYAAPCAASPSFTGGLAGMAGRVTILPIKVLDTEGYGTTESIVEGIDDAVSKGARVLNLSLGGTQFERAEQEAVDRAVTAGCVIVAAAGNEGGGVLYPAAYPPVVAVGAVGPGGVVASYSNRGPGLDLVAPGGAGSALNPTEALSREILSTLMCPTPVGYFLHPSGDSHYGSGAGTSFAAPYVAAAAALLWSVNPTWTGRQVVDRIVSSTVDLAPRGWDNASGYGLLNLRRALAGQVETFTFARTFNSPNPFHPESDVYTNISLTLDAPARVELDIRDSAGNRVLRRIFEPSELNSNPVNPPHKSYSVHWDGRNGSGETVVSGVYPYTVKVGGSSGRNKIVVIRGRR